MKMEADEIGMPVFSCSRIPEMVMVPWAKHQKACIKASIRTNRLCIFG